MSVLVIDGPSRAWDARVNNATYAVAAAAGEAEAMTELVVPAGDGGIVGQEGLGVFTVHEMFFEFDISELAGSRISTVEFALIATDDTDTQTWTCDLRYENWPETGPVDATFVGSGGFAGDQRLCYWTMANANDVPASYADVWTDDGFANTLQAIIDGGKTTLQCYLHSRRHQLELTPVDNERWIIFSDEIQITVEYQEPVTDVAFDIPAPTLVAVDKPHEDASFAIPAPVLAAGNLTGPVNATIPVTAPTLTGTTVRRWGNDELYGLVVDDGRRIGKVV